MHPKQRSFVHSGRSAHTAPGRNSGFNLECSMLGLYVVCQDEMPYCSLSTWNTGSDKHDIAPLAQALYYLHILNLRKNMKPEQRQRLRSDTCSWREDYLRRTLVRKASSKELPNLVRHKQGQTRMSPLGVSGKLNFARKGQVKTLTRRAWSPPAADEWPQGPLT